jgi:fatty-acyl-CoA synthase
VTADELKEFLQDKVKVSWWIPDEFVFMDGIPKTSVGKFNKIDLRKMYAAGELKG